MQSAPGDQAPLPVDRVVVELPTCCQWTVNPEEVLQTGFVAPSDDVFRHVMAALKDPPAYPSNGHPWRTLQRAAVGFSRQTAN